MSVPEAELERTEHGLVPRGEGWLVLDVREARWQDEGPLGVMCFFEGEAGFPQFGINVNVLEPGRPMCMYHREADQEDFLVLRGEALLLVEGEERPLRAWDFVHCPPGTNHVIVVGGDGPAAILAVGARVDSTGPDWAPTRSTRRRSVTWPGSSRRRTTRRSRMPRSRSAFRRPTAAG